MEMRVRTSNLTSEIHYKLECVRATRVFRFIRSRSDGCEYLGQSWLWRSMHCAGEFGVVRQVVARTDARAAQTTSISVLLLCARNRRRWKSGS
jgi:hypothetical protein